jgi:hypothetical protein
MSNTDDKNNAPDKAASSSSTPAGFERASQQEVGPSAPKIKPGPHLVGASVQERRPFEERDYEFVRECWNDVRTCRGLDLYFGEKLAKTSGWNKGFEFGIATFATSSGAATGTAVIAAWAFWQTGPGQSLWAILIAGAALAAWIKPFVGFDRNIERYSKLQQEYRALFGLLRDLPFAVQQENQVTQDHQVRYKKIRERTMQATQQWPATMKDDRIEHFRQRVMNEMPANTLWMPKIAGLQADAGVRPPVT